MVKMEQKLKSLRIDCLYLFIIMFVGFLLRYFIYIKQKYIMNIDSYAYLYRIKEIANWKGREFLIDIGKLLGENGFIIFLMVVSILSLGLFYILCRRYTTKTASLIAGILFAISPLVFFNNQFGITDKNVPTIFMIILCMLLYSIKNRIIRFITLIPALLFFRYVWSGWYAMFILIFAGFAFESILRKELRMTLVYGIISVIGFILGWCRFYSLVEPVNRHLISELSPIWNLPPFAEYIVIIIVWILMFTKLRLEKKNTEKLIKYVFLYIGLILTFFYMCFVFRINIYFIIFLYLWVAILLDDLKYRWMIKSLYVIGIFSLIIFLSVNIYMREPEMNDGLKEVMDYVNNLEYDCIVGLWDMGHIYQYYAPDKNVYYSASANNYKEQLEYMVYGNKSTNCIIIYSDEDLDALNYMLVFENENISKEEYWVSKKEPIFTSSYKDNNYYVVVN